MNIVFKNKDNRDDFISFLNPKMKILVFQDQIDYDFLFLGSKRKKIKENENTLKQHMNVFCKDIDRNIFFHEFVRFILIAKLASATSSFAVISIAIFSFINLFALF